MLQSGARIKWQRFHHTLKHEVNFVSTLSSIKYIRLAKYYSFFLFCSQPQYKCNSKYNMENNFAFSFISN